MTDPTQRFSSRVQNYIRYRPDYPPAVIEALQAHCGLRPQHVVADVGSGTGKLAELFLQAGNRVVGIEPNRVMREAGERLLADYPRFVSLDGTAEAIPLADDAADFITAGQAYHWFDPPCARPEFRRVLRPDGWVALVWNERLSEGTEFLEDYERLMRIYAIDYENVGHKRIGAEAIRADLGFESMTAAVFPNEQSFDLPGLTGRLLSSSYAPEPGHPAHSPMLAELGRLFERHQRGGRVAFLYETKVYIGRPGG